MKIVVFGLGISSTWGNGHATHWRALSRALARAGHRLVFFERDTPYYAMHRDDPKPDGCDLRLYCNWDDVTESAADELASADAGIVTSYCPDGPLASALLLDSAVPARVFYDLDTPVTLEALAKGEAVPYLPREGLSRFDLVLSFTGGPAPAELERVLGARRSAPLYGCVDLERYPRVPAAPSSAHESPFDLSYLGTYASDRQPAFERLLVEPARRRPRARFLVGGPQYPDTAAWPPNVVHRAYVDQKEHVSFYGSSRLTLSLTRRAMQALGFCPSARLFEAAACGVPIASDPWFGLGSFFEEGREILVVRTTEEVLVALALDREHLQSIARAAHARVLFAHSADKRAAELVELLEKARACRSSARAQSREQEAASHVHGSSRPSPAGENT